MQTSSTHRRIAGTVAVVATATLGLVAAATPADAVGPTARLKNETVSVTGTSDLVVPANVGASNAIDGVRANLKRGTLTVQGGDGGQLVALRVNAADPSVVQVDAGDNGSADFTFVRADIDAINVRLGDGNDFARIDDANGAFTDSIRTTIAGGDGNDSLEGGQIQIAAENERFRGGGGSDFVDGGKGNDSANLGAGNDTFRWDNGEGSDTIEGQDGSDTMVFNGAAIAENVTMSANDGRLRFFRVQGNVTMDTAGIEIVDDNALGGADSMTVNDLTGTDVTLTNLDLAGTLGGSTGDGAVDSVIVNGTDANDDIAITGNSSGADVTGLTTAVSIRHSEPTDNLAVNTLAGTDHVTTTGGFGLQVLVDGVAV